ncbi:MAG: site-2 protease family protein [Deltaproteobacteria bacterium]|nr:site-2 protease family protein [Deltaproteobacteria bacterium]
MFRGSTRIGRIAGFEIDVHITFWLLLAFVAIFEGILAGLVLAVFVFGSVLLHELGHAVVARHLGVPIAGIELYFFGGVAKMAGPPRSARDEIWIASAGPAVSFILGGVSALLAFVTGIGVFRLLAYVNLVLGAFNLLPALPMDGGRVMRAALSRRMGRLQATVLAVRITHWAAVGIGVLGALMGSWQLVLLAVVLWFMGSQEGRMAGMWHYEDEEPSFEVLDSDGSSVGWYSRDGQRTGARDAAPPGFGRGRRHMYRGPDGSHVVIEHWRW